MFDCEGKFFKEIGNDGSITFSCPKVKTGHLVVVDEERTQILTLDRMFVAKFGEDKLLYPDCVSVLPERR